MIEDTINPETFLFLVKMEDADTGNFAWEQIPGTVSSAWNMGQTVATFQIESAWLMDVYFGYS